MSTAVPTSVPSAAPTPAASTSAASTSDAGPGATSGSRAFSFDAASSAEDVTAGLDLTGKTILITGCNSGLGYESARVLAGRGAHIIGLARTEAKATAALASLGISADRGDPVACDLSDLTSVRAAVAAVHGLARVDVIMANAGIMALPELRQISGLERQFFVNHLGHFVLVTGLLDHLSDAARVVMLSSAAIRYAKRGLELHNLDGRQDYDPWRLYGRSKLANLAFARGLAARFAGGAKTAVALHPGVIDTNLGRHIPDREAMYERLRPMMKTVGQGAATQCYAAVHPECAGLSGVYLSDCRVEEAPAVAMDDAAVAALWRESEALVAQLSDEPR